MTSGRICMLAVLALTMTLVALWPHWRRLDRTNLTRRDYEQRLGELDPDEAWGPWGDSEDHPR